MHTLDIRVEIFRPAYSPDLAPCDFFLFIIHPFAHPALSIRQLYVKNGMTIFSRPPYSPDLAPCDLFLFPELKAALKRRRPDTIVDIKTSPSKALQDNLKEIFKDYFAGMKIL